jgi:hypothetical protein
MLRNLVLVLSLAFALPPKSHGIPSETAKDTSNSVPARARTDVPAKSKKVVLSIADSGLSNTALRLNEKDGSVFFFNDSSSDEVTLSVAWGTRAAHCASDNLKLEKDGALRTVRPMKKKDFSVVCFPESGEYRFVVAGLPAKGAKGEHIHFNGKIIVP